MQIQLSCPTIIYFVVVVHTCICTVFPNSFGVHVHGQIYTVAIFITEKSKRTNEQGTLLKNFWQSFCGKMKLCLASAVVKASLLLRCGDVETNPGPLTKEGKISLTHV